MITQILMGVCILIGLVLIAPNILGMIRNRKDKDEVVPNENPNVQPAPSPSPLENTVVENNDPKPETRESLALIVSEWESFVKLLEANDMPESAEDMKTLLTKMVGEYRSDLNEDDDQEDEEEKDSGIGSIEGIVAVDESPEKGE